VDRLWRADCGLGGVVPYPGIWYDGPFLFYGAGFGIGLFGGYGWGWHHWGFDWHHHYAIYNHDRYYSHRRTFYNQGEYYRREGARGGDLKRGGNRDGRGPEPFWPLLNDGEGAVLYCFIFLFLASAGGGPWSFDRLLRKRASTV